MLQGYNYPLQSAFLALPLEGKEKWLFQALQEELKPWEEVLAFQNPQSPHLTLQFWPEVMEIEYGRILRQSEDIARKASPFTLKVQGAQTFGARGDDRVLFLAVPFSEELARLRKLCPWPSAQPFSPHITLARIRHPQRFRVVKKALMKRVDDANFTMDVNLLRLYAEIEGRYQTPLEDFPFSPQ
ncbi:MAG: 2'-5' RNA ligase family protein [Candidatus Peribacteraceae bacterium]|jgi:2'-5' RNA ligase